MIRLFISLPMSGKDSKQIDVEIAEAVYHFKEMYKINDDISLIQTNIYLGENATPIDYLAESIRLMGYADAVFFVKGWNEARGCLVEHLVAEKYGYQIYEEK